MSGAVVAGVGVVVAGVGKAVKYLKRHQYNMCRLKESLKSLCYEKRKMEERIKIGKEKFQEMTGEAASWAKELWMLTTDRDLWAIMKKDKQVAGMVEELMTVAEEEEEAAVVKYKKAAQVVVEVIKEFKKLVKGNEEMAVVATRWVKEEDMAKLMRDDMDMANAVRKAREAIDDELWRSDVSDPDDDEIFVVDNNNINSNGNSNNNSNNSNGVDIKLSLFKRKVELLLKRLGHLMDNEHVRKALPREIVSSLEILEGVREIMGLNKPINWIIKDRTYARCYSVYGFYRQRIQLSQAAERLAVDFHHHVLDAAELGPVTRPVKAADAINEFLKGLDSREQLLQNIFKALQNDQVNAVALVGTKGSGKTTLAKEVARTAQSIFEKTVMIEISEDPNIESIQDMIAEQIGLSLKDMDNLDQRASKLYNRLKPHRAKRMAKRYDKEKKVLIILDNTSRNLNLYKVGIPPDIAKDDCCKILLTSKDEDVCKGLGIQDANIFEVDRLSEDEARYLFQNKLGSFIDVKESFMVDKILSNCGFFPLAIVEKANDLKQQHYATALRA